MFYGVWPGGVAGNVCGIAGRQTRAGAGRHPKDQQGETAATERGTDVGVCRGWPRPVCAGRRIDRRLPVDVRTVVCLRDGPHHRRRQRPRCGRPAEGRHGHSDGHGAGGQT